MAASIPCTKSGAPAPSSSPSSSNSDHYPRHPTQSKSLKIIIDRLYQYVIIVRLTRRDLSPAWQPCAPLTYLESTLTREPISVASEELTERVSLLSATLTKNRGRGAGYG